MDNVGVLSLLKRQGQVGSNRDTPQSATLSGLVSTLVPTLILAVAYVALFLVLRRTQPRQYAPRTYLGSLPPQERTPALPNTLLGWIPQFHRLPDTYVLQHNSIDAYFLLRYLKISVTICLVGCLITWPILFPVNATGGAGQKQLDVISFSNIVNPKRYYAHALVAWLFVLFVLFMVTREMIYFINTRQAYLLSPMYESRISSRTVLFGSLPTSYASEAKMRTMFGDKLKNVWIPTDTFELADLVDKRTKAAMKLEAAETKLIKRSNRARLKAEKEAGGSIVPVLPDAEVGNESGSVAARYISPKKRPTHRLRFLIGKKVDTINWARQEIARLNPIIEKLQREHREGKSKPLASAIVEFYSQTEAQAAYQMVAHHMPLHMTPRVVGFSPEEIIWENMRITWKTRAIRLFATSSAIAVTVLFWSAPVAFVGALSQISYLVTILPWLSFINKIPAVILGVISYLLPVIALSVLMALLPIYLKFMAQLSGIPTLSAVELHIQESFFWFQVIQVFLITTMTSAVSAAVPVIFNNPASVTSILAQNLPKASNIYISYFILQGLTFSSGALVQIFTLIMDKVLGRLLDSTPRKMYGRWSNLDSLGWGTVLPVLELLTVISITYSCIAPLVLGFATIGLWLFYIAFRYNLLFVNTSDVDTKGLIYPKALHHTVVGCYLLVICLIGLFGIQAAPGPFILMILLLAFLVLYHISLTSAVHPLLHYLPRSLEAEEDALIAAYHHTHPDAQPYVDAKNASQASTSNAPPHREFEESGLDHNKGATEASVILPPAPHKEPNFFIKWLRPDVYTDYAAMRRLVPHDFQEIKYDRIVERTAYEHPAVKDEVPLLWVPRDIMGVSRQECAYTSKVTPMTDEGAFLDDKGNVVWDIDGTDGRPPIYEEKIYY